MKSELQSYYNKYLVEAGCDEVGRGCLAGPVVAAAVILPKDYRNPDINDSKQLSSKKRAKLKDDIIRDAISWGVAFIDNKEIDSINILKASIKAMHKALDQLSVDPQFVIVDGNKFYQYKDVPYKTIVKGDSLYLSIAAASILAKVTRDEYMEKMHDEYPQYGWNKNKGYGTLEHRKAILKYGITPLHRTSFALFDTQTSFDFQFYHEKELYLHSILTN